MSVETIRMAGPECGACQWTEQDCARNYPYCEHCDHDFGEPEEPEPQTITCRQCGHPFSHAPVRGRPPVKCEPCRTAPPTMSRCTSQYAGTDTGYTHHVRRDGTPPCDACKAAHAAAERERKNRRDPTRNRRTTMTQPLASAGQSPTITELLARARQLDHPKATRAAAKVTEAADKLRDALAEAEKDTAARREVERLEQQLAAAKARLRGTRQGGGISDLR